MHRRRALPVLFAVALSGAMPACGDDDPVSENVGASCETMAQELDGSTGVGNGAPVDPVAAVEAEARNVESVFGQLHAQAPAEISDDVKILTDHMRRTCPGVTLSDE
jgi:hypothetical protein